MTLVFLALAWFVAMAAVAAWQAPWWMAGAWIATASPAILLIRAQRRDLALVVTCTLVALAGGWWFARWDEQPPPPLVSIVGTEATVEGTIAGLPSPGDTTQSYVVDVDAVVEGESTRPTSGGLRITIDQYGELRPGDRVRITGEIEVPPVFDGFDYRAYLARQGIVGTLLFPDVEIVDEGGRWELARVTGDARARLQDGIERSLPEPEASLASGIVLGLDGGLSDEVEEDFRRSGLAHFVAVSGSNIELVTLAVFVVLTPVVGRRRAVAPAAAMIVVYAVMAGAEAPVVRAGIMAAILLAGWLMGRHRSALAGLAGAAVVMTMVSPGIAVEAGFQMSVAATAGLIVFAPWIRAALGAGAARARVGGVVPGPVLDVVALSVSATLAVLPISWVTFERVSLIGPLTNVLVAPVFAVAFGATALVAAAELVGAPAGWFAGLFAYYPLAFIVWVAEASAAIPGSSVPTPAAGATVAIVAYAVMALAAWPAYRYMPPETPVPGRSSAAPMVRRVALGAAAGLAAVVVLSASIMPGGAPGELRVEFLDVGQGDAILITTPERRQVLVDGGPGGLPLMRELGTVLPHWDQSLDAVIVTHPQSDHLGGLAELARRYDVGIVYDAGVEGASAGYLAYDAAFPERERLRAGDRMEWDGVSMEVLWPPGFMPDEAGDTDLNDTSLVLMLEYGEVSMLLTGDITAGVQRTMLSGTSIRADVLKVPHHGSRTSAVEFFDAVGPALAVITVGEGNRYGHPAEEILEALAGAMVLRTDEDGRVTIVTDGERLQFGTGR